MRLLDKAIMDLNSAIAIEATSTTGLNSLGLALCEQGHHEDALAMMNKAVETAPKNPTLLSNRGVILFHLGRQAEAVRVRGFWWRGQGAPFTCAPHGDCGSASARAPWRWYHLVVL